MEERIIRLPELITYHQINEVWEESIACFCTKSDMKISVRYRLYLQTCFRL